MTRRGVLNPDFPNPPQNQLWFRNKPAEKCIVKPGEWFVIGQTRFTLRGDADAEPDSPVDGTLVQRQEERSEPGGMGPGCQPKPAPNSSRSPEAI